MRKWCDQNDAGTAVLGCAAPWSTFREEGADLADLFWKSPEDSRPAQVPLRAPQGLLLVFGRTGYPTAPVDRQDSSSAGRIRQGAAIDFQLGPV